MRICPEAPPKIGDQCLGEFFSWKRRRVETGEIVWLKKVYVIYTYSHDLFNDYTTLDSKLLFGGRISLAQILFSGGQSHREPNWNIYRAFSSSKAREKYLEQERLQAAKNAAVYEALEAGDQERAMEILKSFYSKK